MIKNFSLTAEERKTLKEFQKIVTERWKYVRVTTLILVVNFSALFTFFT